MISSKTVKAAVSGLVCLAGATALPAQITYNAKEFWNQPHIRQAFLGSYEVNRTTEPTLTQEEQVLFRNVLNMISGPDAGPDHEANRQKALNTLLPAATPTATAAFDFAIGNFYAEMGDLRNAIKFYDQATAKFPNFLRTIRNAAIMRVQDGRFDAAIKGLTKSLELGQKDHLTYGLLGLCYVNTDRYISAETAYREAIVLDPTQKDWQVGLAKALIMQRKYPESIAMLEQILIDQPEDDVLWQALAQAYQGMEDLENTVAIQEIVDRLGKATPDSLLLMGQIYLSRGLSELAVTYFQRSIEMDPNQQAGIHIDIAESVTGHAAYDQATAIIKDIRSTFGQRLSDEEKLRVLRLEAQIALATQQGESVIPILEELIERDPLDGQALLLLADYYSEKGDPEGYARADIYFERAVGIRGWEDRALVTWARSYVAREQYGRAIPLLERKQVMNNEEHIGRYLEQIRKVHQARRGM